LFLFKKLGLVSKNFVFGKRTNTVFGKNFLEQNEKVNLKGI